MAVGSARLDARHDGPSPTLIAGPERPLSGNQLNRLEVWLRHQMGWRRNIIPPRQPSYMVQVEHSDGTQMFVMLFLRERSNVYFSKHAKDRRFDAGWLSLPVEEVDNLIGMPKRDA